MKKNLNKLTSLVLLLTLALSLVAACSNSEPPIVIEPVIVESTPQPTITPTLEPTPEPSPDYLTIDDIPVISADTVFIYDGFAGPAYFGTDITTEDAQLLLYLRNRRTLTTQERTVIESDKYIITLPEGIKYMSDIKEAYDRAVDTLEELTGWKLLTGNYGKLKVGVSKEDYSYAPYGGYSIYMIPEAFCDISTFVHEVTHALVDRHGHHNNITHYVMSEGFATFMEGLVNNILDEPDLSMCHTSINQYIYNETELTTALKKVRNDSSSLCHYYNLGAYLCMYIYENFGMEMLLKTYTAIDRASRSTFISTFNKTLGVDILEVFPEWYADREEAIRSARREFGETYATLESGRYSYLPDLGRVKAIGSSNINQFNIDITGPVLIDFRVLKEVYGRNSDFETITNMVISDWYDSGSRFAAYNDNDELIGSSQNPTGRADLSFFRITEDIAKELAYIIIEPDPDYPYWSAVITFTPPFHNYYW